MHKSTLMNFRNGWQPTLSDWNSYDVWQKTEPADIEQRAHIKAREIIDNAKPLLDESTIRDLKKYIADNE